MITLEQVSVSDGIPDGAAHVEKSGLCTVVKFCSKHWTQGLGSTTSFWIWKDQCFFFITNSQLKDFKWLFWNSSMAFTQVHFQMQTNLGCCYLPSKEMQLIAWGVGDLNVAAIPRSLSREYSCARIGMWFYRAKCRIDHEHVSTLSCISGTQKVARLYEDTSTCIKVERTSSASAALLYCWTNHMFARSCCKGKSSTQTPNQILFQMKSNLNPIKLWTTRIVLPFTASIKWLANSIIRAANIEVPEPIPQAIILYPHFCTAFLLHELKKLQSMHTLGKTCPCISLLKARPTGKC